MILLAVFLTALLAFLVSRPVHLVTADLGRHLINGQIFLDSLNGSGTDLSRLLGTNFYSYTFPDFPFVNHHWGSGVVFRVLENLAGFQGLSVFYTGLVCLGFVACLSVALAGASRLAALIASLFVLPLVAYRTEIRPEAFSFALCGVFFAVLQAWEKNRLSDRWLYSLPVLMLFWVNLHIQFVFGFFILLVHLGWSCFRRDAKSVRSLGRIAALTFAAMWLNPIGYRLLIYPFEIFSNYGYMIVENQSIGFFLARRIMVPVIYPYFAVAGAFALTATALCRADRSRLQVVPALIGLTFLGLGFGAIRNIGLFGLLALPALAFQLDSLLGLLKGKARLGASVAAFTAGLVVLFPALSTGIDRFGTGLVPGIDAGAEFLKRNRIAGPVFNNYDVGGYLIYHLYPAGERVFVDNRPEAYPDSFFTQVYVPVQEKKELWQQLDLQRRFNTIVFYRHDLTPWGQAFMIDRVRDPLWAPVFVDDHLLILLRRTQENQSVIQRFEIPRSRFSVAPSG